MAKQKLTHFLIHTFPTYTEHRNQPQTDDVSYMSQYLHFGQISPLYLALQIQAQSDVARHHIDTYLEELIVRRELAMNFVYYTPDYDAYSCVPNWAQKPWMPIARIPDCLVILLKNSIKRKLPIPTGMRL